MAKNVEITGNMPAFYQANSRPVSDITIADLEGKDEAFSGFSVEEGDVYKFPVLDKAQLKQQRVQRDLRPNEKPTYVYSVGAQRVRNGVTSNVWFSLNFLKKQDANRNYVNPSWVEIGDARTRLEKLCEMGEITVLKAKKIRVPRFENGRPVRVPTLDPNTGDQKIDQFGGAMTHVDTVEQTAYEITPVA
jgi:hypothetical protein